MTAHTLHHQPDNPGAVFPTCRQRWPDEDGDLEKLIRKNINRVSLAEIARAFGTTLSHAMRVMARAKPPIDLPAAAPSEKEHDPRGA